MTPVVLKRTYYLLPWETVSQCHSEALAEACPEQNEGTHEILHFVQGDTWRRVQNDKHAISLIVTQPLVGEGEGEGDRAIDLNSVFW